MINTLLFFACWALVCIVIVTIVMFAIMTPIHEKQAKLQEDMKKNQDLLWSLRNG